MWPQVGSILVTGLGAAALMKGPFPHANFFIAGVAVYMGTIVLEAVSMSLCSKVRPEGWVGLCTPHMTCTHLCCPCNSTPFALTGGQYAESYHTPRVGLKRPVSKSW